MKKILFLLSVFTFLATALLFANTPKKIPVIVNTYDSLVCTKHLHLLVAYSKGKVVKTYVCGVGSNALGHKQYRGDNRTPEGTYYITERNAGSKYFLNLHISYPNANDVAQCKKLGYKIGGDIKIHGYADATGNTSNKQLYYAYTWGCIGVCNADMRELFDKVKLGSPITILP
jgi:murein L,D-transpeptidase YafK